ncbi:MAG TPA: BON domain-containing protein [Bacillota bacterium]|nr:BON domain-containing protein [Bacillota bacterium]
MRTFKNLLLLGGLSAAVALTGLTGCQSSKSKDPAAAQAARDKEITKQVQTKLKSDPVYKFTEADAKAMNNTVQLSGFVASEGEKRHAEDLARQVPGVNQVVNNLTVQSTLMPTGRTNQMDQPQAYPETQPK